jgi:hypothetical protein
MAASYNCRDDADESDDVRTTALGYAALEAESKMLIYYS